MMCRTALLCAVIGLAASQAAPYGAFIEANNLVAIEVEMADSGPAGAWEHENTLVGYDGTAATGTGYYIWKGPNVFNSPGSGALPLPANLNRSPPPKPASLVGREGGCREFERANSL